jgi:hypothetical protein
VDKNNTKNIKIMTSEVKDMYKKAKKNDIFLQSLKEAGEKEMPNILSSEIEKHIFAITYYGWLIGRYGSSWEEHK